MINLLLPSTCPSCGAETEGPGLDEKCWRQVSFVKPPFCRLCSRPLTGETNDENEEPICGGCRHSPPPWRAARVAFLFKGVGRRLVLRYKYADRIDCTDFLARMLLKAAAPLLEDCRFIVPVPLARMRLFLRRYNQSALLANRLAELSGREVSFALVATRRTEDQTRLGKTRRFKNMRGAFCAVKDEIAGENVLLLDDVRTSGATATHCAEALLRGGARSVSVATLAWVAV